ncbi:phosphoribosyltransferase family protein [Gynurincola endophyticus]|uniref:phosphoribosyltransferase family protein n=1 Tax=Gynurincola endophyticus TaxID=2479004 RepID=UPI0018F7B580|nr:phosphoribosyltransferase family protein [Gynurincola endophyticus]
MNFTYSLHKINHRNDLMFDASGYSLFKFGDTSWAEKMANALFDGFVKEYGSVLLNQKEIVLLASPYCSIPTASNFLCYFFRKRLNEFLYMNKRDACLNSKIHRKQTYVEDYGNLDYKQRIDLISNDSYYIDREFVEGKFCIFLDDIKITGSHEFTINKILKEYNVSGRFVFVYFAELANKLIHPSIENYYNYYAVKSPEDIVSIMRSSVFKFNTRIVKYILLMKDIDFMFVIQRVESKQKRELFDLAISNNYHKIMEYKKNLQKLNNLLWQLTYKKDNGKVLAHQSLPLV